MSNLKLKQTLTFEGEKKSSNENKSNEFSEYKKEPNYLLFNEMNLNENRKLR